jgi:ADP-ribosylglycohydrolase
VTSYERVEPARAEGTFAGAAVGDALGWPQEVRGGLLGGQKARDRAKPRAQFREWTRSAGQYASRHHDEVHPGEYSDDTQLLLAVARSCTSQDWWERLTTVELPAWPTYQRGGGGAVLSAAAAWLERRPPWQPGKTAKSKASHKRYCDAGANGVAMRIAPHVLWAEDYDDLISRVVRDGLTTHGHPRALVGALCYSLALSHAVRAADTIEFGEIIHASRLGLVKAEKIVELLPRDWPLDTKRFAHTWTTTNTEMATMLDQVESSLSRGALSSADSTLMELGCADPEVNGAGTVTAAAAVYLTSRFAARPEHGLVKAAYFRKGDTDTLASMTASMLGAMHRTAWLDGLDRQVQDGDYIKNLARQCAAHHRVDQAQPSSTVVNVRRQFAERLTSGETSGEFPDGRTFEVDPVEAIENRTPLTRFRLRLSDGQIVIVDSPGPTGSHHDNRDALQVRGTGDAARSDHTHGQSSESRNDRRRTDDAGVVLATENLRACAAFYAKLLDREIPVRGGAMTITPWLRVQEAKAPVGSQAAVLLTFAVIDPAATARGMGHDPDRDPSQPIRLRDPDGRSVVLLPKETS